MTFAMSYFAMNVTNPGISDIHNEEVKTFVHTYIQVKFPRKKDKEPGFHSGSLKRPAIIIHTNNKQG